MEPIEGLPTVVAFVGSCASGPVGEPVSVSSAEDYHAQFGTSVAGRLDHATDLFFANGGTSVLVVRVDGPGDGGAGEGGLVAGVRALEGSGVTILVVPDLTPGDRDQVREVLERCAAYCCVLLLNLPDAPWTQAQEDLDAIVEHRERLALYHPWVIRDGVRVPPTGAIAGIRVRTDAERGLWRAPTGSGAQLQGVSALAEPMTQRESDAMTVAGVNAVRDFGSRGLLLWGARTLAAATTSEPHERYLPMRRLLDHVARSVTAGLDQAQFTTNEAPVWTEARAGVEEFLDRLWRQGALQGTSPEDAYFVNCGLGETMTETDVEQGRLILQLGMSVMRPAEFVIMNVPVEVGTRAPVVWSRSALQSVAARHLKATELNLSRVFELERAGGVLFFDEADALFGKRTRVVDSHDRYAGREANVHSAAAAPVGGDAAGGAPVGGAPVGVAPAGGESAAKDQGDDVDEGQHDGRHKGRAPSSPPGKHRQDGAPDEDRGRPPGGRASRGKHDDH